ncbi:hypothetical protein PMEGAPL128_55870 [Priestia megaterium]
MKEFLSSFLLITSWLIFAISAYLFVLVIMAPYYAFIPFCKVLGTELVCFYLSKKLNEKFKVS